MDQLQPPSQEWTRLWVQAQPTVAGFVASLVPEFNDADDVVQNVALKTIEQFEVFDRDRSFVAWAIGIAKNEIRTFFRKKGKHSVGMDIKVLDHIAKVYESEASTLHDLRQDLEKALALCMNKLKGKWRNILEMHYLREQTPARIAQKLGMSKNNVLVTLSRIRAALRTCVNHQIQQELM